MNDVAVEPGATAAVVALTPGAVQLFLSEVEVSGMAASQTEGKWGTEHGPAKFRSAYLKALTAINSDIALLDRELIDYINAAVATINSFKDLDTDNAREQDAALANQLNKAQDAHHEREEQRRHESGDTNNSGDR